MENLKDEQVKEIYSKFKKNELIEKLQLTCGGSELANFRSILQALRIDPENE